MYDSIRDYLRGDGYREAMLTAIDGDPDNTTADSEIRKARDQDADIWARFSEQEDKFRRKCLRLPSEITLKSRLVPAKKRKK